MQKFQYKIIHITFAALVVTLFLLATPTKSFADEISTSEIKASWIDTIVGWLNWKNRPKSGITICAVGRDKVYMYLKRNNQKFAIRNKSTTDDFKECNILYISESEQEYYMNMLDEINGTPGIVTISSIGGFAKHGGGIEFVIKKKASLIINLKVIKAAKVAVDDELYGWVQTIN